MAQAKSKSKTVAAKAKKVEKVEKVESVPPLKIRRPSFRVQLAVTSAIAALLLLIGNTALWVNHSFFDTDNFVNTATTSLTSDTSRQALASEVVDRALANRPVIKNVAGDTATKLVSGILATSQFNKVLTTAMSKMQVYLTSSNRQSIVIDLSGVKGVINQIVNLANQVGVNNPNLSNASSQISQVPNQIVLLNSNSLPNVYPFELATLWIGPLAAIGAVIALAYPYFRRPKRYYRIALVQGLVIAAVGLFSLLFGPLIKPVALSPFASANIRVVVGSLYDAFLSQFNSQSIWLVTFGFLLAIVPLLVHYGLKYVPKIAAARAARKNIKSSTRSAKHQ